MKECRRCKKVKCREFFGKRISNSDGLYSYCKECVSKENKERNKKNFQKYRKIRLLYKEKNKEKLNEDAKKYYHIHREAQLKKRNEYRKKNKEKISIKEAYKRLFNEDRFERNRKKHLKWSKDNRERLNEWQRNWYQKNKEKRRAHVILNRAINSGKIL